MLLTRFLQGIFSKVFNYYWYYICLYKPTLVDVYSETIDTEN